MGNNKRSSESKYIFMSGEIVNIKISRDGVERIEVNSSHYNKDPMYSGLTLETRLENALK